MVNICESVIKAVTRNKCKWLIHLNQNGMGTGWESLHTQPTQSTRSPVESRHLTQCYLSCGTRKPCIAPVMGKQSVKIAYGSAGLGCRKKRMSCCNGTDTGFNVTRCESRPTSGGSLFVREFVELIEWEKSK